MKGDDLMRLTILGNNGPYPSANGACSGYLVKSEKTNVLIDCGSGVLSNLQKHIKIEDLDMILLSHLHNDHISDLFVLSYAIQIKMSKGLIKKPIPVFLPSEPIEDYERLNIPGVFRLNPIEDNKRFRIDDLNIAFREMNHSVKSYAISVERFAKRFVYSGDTTWPNDLPDFCRNADLVLLDSCLLEKDKENGNISHMTARECAIIAERARAYKLLLTHLFPEHSEQDYINEAKQVFRNPRIAKISEEHTLFGSF